MCTTNNVHTFEFELTGTYIHVSLYFRAAYAMLIAARLPKDTDVSFITEMIEVCIIISLLILREIYNIYFASNDDSYIKYYLKIMSLKIAATWKFPSVKWQGLGRLFTIADMVHNCIEWCILPVTSQCLFSVLLFIHFIHSLVPIGEFI